MSFPIEERQLRITFIRFKQCKKTKKTWKPDQ